MAEKVTIVTPSRLHFGMVNPFVKELRRYVSAGVAVSNPVNTVVVEEGEGLRIDGCRSSELFSRIAGFAEKHRLSGHVNVMECVPRHVGLGSTTQLVLAAAYGLAVLNGSPMDPVEIARETGLGRYSGVGTYVFKHGGFILDAGKSASSEFPALLTRLEFPEDWVFIVIVPPGQGLGEAQEDMVFREQSEIPLELVWKASHHMLELSSSVADRDYSSFTRALTMLQETVGSMFSRYQGGVFSTGSSEAVRALRKAGVEGVGQSSWGPTVYGVVEGLEEAEKILGRIERKPDWRIFVAKPCNRGALVNHGVEA